MKDGSLSIKTDNIDMDEIIREINKGSLRLYTILKRITALESK